MSVNSSRKQSFIEALQAIIAKAKTAQSLKLEQVFQMLAHRGFAAMLLLLSLPVCFPIHVPGTSTPFGIMLAILGYRLALGKSMWLPKWILDKEVTSEHLVKMMEGTIKVVRKSQKLIGPRLTFLISSPFLCRFNGVIIFLLAVLLSIPLPIPFAHLVPAIPIFFISLALLEDDGVLALIGYVLAAFAFAFFFELFLFGKHHYTDFRNWFGAL